MEEKMESKSLRVCMAIMLCMILSVSLHAGQKVATGNITLSDGVSVTVEESNDTRTVLRFNIGSFNQEPVDIGGKQFFKIACNGEPVFMNEGEPELPLLCRSIIIPDDAKMKVNVLSQSYVDYEKIMVVPSKGSLPFETDPADVPYSFGPIYSSNTWYPKDLANIREPYILRDYRGTVVELHPFQYNPGTEILRVYNSVTVEVVNVGSGTVNILDIDRENRSVIRDFDQIYSKRFLNYDSYKARYTPIDEYGEMLIITHDAFYDEMLPFVEWKRQKGITTTMINVSQLIGYERGGFVIPDRDPDDPGKCCYGDPYEPECDVTQEDDCLALGGSWNGLVETCDEPCPLGNPDVSSDEIRDYIMDFYDNYDLAYVLLVGDLAQIASPDHPYETNVPSDPTYTLMAGSDFYPDLFVGRFSAQEDAHAITQIDRTITYERDLMQGQDWLAKATGIAIYFREVHMNAIRDKLLEPSYNYTLVDQLYDPNVSGSDISNALNDGRGFVNYCSHGSPLLWCMTKVGADCTAWFSMYDVDGLNNANELPFIMSVSCETGKFSWDCFAESWLRATNYYGDPTGAIAVYMSSVNQTQGVPEIAQTEFTDLLVTDNKSTFGGLCFNSVCKMIDDCDVYHWKKNVFYGWTIFGDPSLKVRTDDPTPMSISHVGEIFYTDQTYHVDVGFDGAYCALYYEGVIYGAERSGHGGIAEIPINQEIMTGDPITLTVTALNRETIQEEIIVNYDVAINHTPLTDTKNCIENQLAPNYEVVCEIYAGSAFVPNGHTPNLVYQINYETQLTMVPLVPTGNDYEYAAAIPLQPAGTQVTYSISAETVEGASDMVGPFVFQVIGYKPVLESDVLSQSHLLNQSVWFDLTVTNDGVLDDLYQLSSACGWTVNIFDETGTTIITATDLLQIAETFNFKVEVIVGSGVEDEEAAAVIRATSDGDPNIYTELSLQVISEGSAIELPFVDNFDTDIIDEVNWNRQTGGDLSDQAVYDTDPETPQAYSLHLYQMLPFQPGGMGISLPPLLSNIIDLSDQSQAYKLIYWYERAGNDDSPEETDDLIIRYKDEQANWHELDRQLGSGLDMTSFEKVEVAIPANGEHLRFVLEISCESSAHSEDPINPWIPNAIIDEWYFDNISIVATLPGPTLVSPDNMAASQNSTPTLIWDPVIGADQYQVVIDNNSDFSSPYNQVILTNTSWVVDPALLVDTYYWKVRAGYSNPDDWGNWSEVRTYIRQGLPQPPTSCPVLFSFNGNDYVEENPVLTACEASNYTEIVTDYYHITTPISPIDGKLQFQLREMEDEITYLHDLELITVDHSSATKMAVSIEGNISLYDDVVAPLTAIDHNGDNRLTQVAKEDGELFSCQGEGHLIVTFPLDTDDDFTFGISCGPKPLCPKIPKAVGGENPQITSSTLKVEYLDGSDNWVETADIPTRENITEEFISSSIQLSKNQTTVTIKLSWTDGYSVDVIRRLVPSVEIPVINSWQISDHDVESNQECNKAWSGFDNNGPLILKKDEHLDFSFATGSLAGGTMYRDYVIKAVGRYHPDYKVFTDVLPKQFKLYDNYPNPFNPSTTISFDIPVSSHIKLEVVNLLGRKVAGLIDRVGDAGHYQIEWNGQDDSGNQVASGVYFYRLTTDNYVETKKMMLVK
jgi:Peptidase family C25/Propeptide_C25/Peptidase family C25, C terminal ig-like domain